MSDTEMTFQQQLEDFVQIRVDEWEIDNPEPDVVVDPQPPIPKSEFVSISNGFVVFDPKHGYADMHISKNGSDAVCVKLGIAEFKKLLEVMLEVEAGLQELADWSNEGREDRILRDRWLGSRSTVIRDAKLEFERLQSEPA